MSFIEHGTGYDFLSKKEKVEYNEAPYQGALVGFLISSIAQMLCISAVYFLFQAKCGLTISVIITFLSLITSRFYLEMVKTYSNAVKTAHWENLDFKITVTPYGCISVICAFMLPFITTLSMIIIATTQDNFTSQILACLCAGCILINAQSVICFSHR